MLLVAQNIFFLDFKNNANEAENKIAIDVSFLITPAI
jgi:hypothetical protein